jgi:hypothetical protein
MEPELGRAASDNRTDPLVGERKRREGLVVLPEVECEAVLDQWQ